jgi:hypothetical protein
LPPAEKQPAFFRSNYRVVFGAGIVLVAVRITGLIQGNDEA